MYLTGSTNDRIEPTLIGLGIGLMVQPGNGYLTRSDRYPSIAADNGCYAASRKPEGFDPDVWWRWLGTVPRGRCLFACSPDVLHWHDGEPFGDAVATLDLAERWLPVIRQAGFPAALVAQDGLPDLTVPWDSFDALFVGGSTAFKLAEPTLALVAEAKARGKWTHLGRCNTKGRILAAAATGVYDSADGTKLGFGDRRNLPELVRWLDQAAAQPGIWTLARPARDVHAADTQHTNSAT
jgi:hypothetical protein